MTTSLARAQDTQTTSPAPPARDVTYGMRDTVGWYGDASGVFIVETPDARSPHLPFLLFPTITSSSRIDRPDFGRSVERAPNISALPVERQVRELQAALSLNKSELARILRVSRPTVYDWLDGGDPSDANGSRIRALLRLVSEARVSSRNPLFRRFVRSAPGPGEEGLLDLLREETIDPAAVRRAIRAAKALGDAMDKQRAEREARLRKLGFEEPDAERRRANLATNMALKAWPRE